VPTNASGVATLDWVYPSFGLGPEAYYAKVSDVQQVISSPVMLTAARETVLPLNVSKQSGFNHTISGRLLSYGEPVRYKQVKVFVNDALKATLGTAYPNGDFSLTLDLPPVDNKPTSYRIVVSFDGDNPSNATAYAYTPNGTKYAICTTIQFGYKPVANRTLLTVEPQATQVTTPTKTPEQMQQEAQQSGWLLPASTRIQLILSMV
jgi:hypothetical protein